MQKRKEEWIRHRTTQPEREEQLEWAANVVEYVQYIHKKTGKRAGTQNGTAAPSLRKEVPLLGPRFLPPTYLHLQKRSTTPTIEPQSAYLKAITIIHPFYFPELAKCPQCGTASVGWNGWTTTGPRNVHGICRDETAYGVQVQCRGACETLYSGGNQAQQVGTYCFATTSVKFWENREHWDVPRMSPYQRRPKQLLTMCPAFISRWYASLFEAMCCYKRAV